MMKRIISLLCVMSMSLTLFAGCGSSSASSEDAKEDAAAEETTEAAEEETAEEETLSDEPVTLKFVNWIGSEDAVAPALEAMIAAFEEKYPNVTVESVAYPYNNVQDQLLIMSAGGSAPDCAQVKGEWVASLNNVDALLPLNDMISEETMEDYYPSLVEGGTYGGELVSAPWCPSVIGLYYNKTLLEQAGFSEPATTWAELMEQSEAIANLGTDANGNKIYGLGVATKNLVGAGYFFLLNMWNNGGEFIDADGNLAIDSPENVKAFEEIQTLVQNGVVPEGLEVAELRSIFAQGQLGYTFDLEVARNVFCNESSKGEAFADEIGVTYVPGIDSPEGQTLAVEHRLVAFKDSPNQEWAVKFIEFLSSAECMEIYTSNAGGKLPSRESAEVVSYYSAEGNEWINTFSESLAFANSMPAENENFLAACTAIAESIQRVALNDEDPQTVVTELSAEVNELYSE